MSSPSRPSPRTIRRVAGAHCCAPAPSEPDVPVSGHPARARALAASGLPKIHIHDLRHTRNTLAAATGATLKELMTRMRHSSTKAAMVYLHAAKDRARAIADARPKGKAW